MKTYFVVAECQNHIDKLKNSWLVEDNTTVGAFEMAKGALQDTADPGMQWVIVKFERVE